MKLGTKAALAVGGVAVLLGGAVTASSMLDAGWMRTRLTAAVKQQTGRDLRIDTLHVWILPYPWVEAKGVGLAGRTDGTGDEMFTAREMRARLALGPLLAHRVVLDNVTVMAPSLTLERTADGKANWVFEPQPPTPASGGGSSSAGVRWNLALSSLHLRGGNLSWADARNHLSGTTDLDQADVTGLTGETVALDVRGHHGTGAFAIKGTTGALLPLPEQNWPVHLTTTLTVDKRRAGELHVDGLVANPRQDSGYDIQIGGTLDELAGLESLFPHANLPDADDVSLQAGLVGSGADPRLRMLHLHTGAVDFSTLLAGLHADSVTVDATQPSDRVSVTMDGKLNGQPLTLRGLLGTLDETVQALRKPDASALPLRLSLEDGDSSLTLDGVAGGGKTSLDVHGALPTLTFGPGRPAVQGLKVDGHLACTAALSLLRERDPLIWLHAVQATLDVGAQRVTWESVAWEAASAHVTVEGGRLTADPIHATGTGVAQGMAQGGRLTFDAAQEPPHLAVTASPLVLPAQIVETVSGLPPLMNGSLQVVGSLVADGADPDSWKRTATGHVGLSMVGGRIDGQALAGLLGRGIPVRGAMGLRCLGVHMQLAEARATLERIGLEADMLSLTGHGTVGLENGTLDLHLVPRIGVAGAAASSPVGVGGTLAAPQPHLEPNNDGRFAISLGDPTATADQCPDLLASAREGTPGPAAAPPPATKGNSLMNMLKGLMR